MELRSVNGFLTYLSSISLRTSRVIETIPPDKIDWKPHPEAFSLADIIRHLGAMEYHVWAQAAQFKVSTYPGHDKNLADGYQAVMEYYSRCRQRSLEIYKTLENEDLMKKCTTPAGIQITLWKWLRAWFEHEIHHRGQLYTYLRLLKVDTPPIFGLTSEQVRINSQSE